MYARNSEIILSAKHILEIARLKLLQEQISVVTDIMVGHDGVHTVQYDYTGLTGTITIQGTLATSPTDTDWFDVAPNSSQETAVI